MVGCRGEGISAGGAPDVGVSPGAGILVCVLVTSPPGVECSSGSTDVDVMVRYKAVCNAATGRAQLTVTLQFQTPKLGKTFSMIPPESPQFSPVMAIKVQPLGSSVVLTPSVWIPSGRSG